MSRHIGRTGDDRLAWNDSTAARPPANTELLHPPLSSLTLASAQTQYPDTASGLFPENRWDPSHTHSQRQMEWPHRHIDAGHVPSTFAMAGPIARQPVSDIEPRRGDLPAFGGQPVAALAEESDSGPSQRSSRRQRTRQPGDMQWQQNKAHIERLYMKENLALSEVVLRMERDHGFHATERMYKNKFKLWRWSKNLPHEKALWMTEKAQQRMPRKTTFYWNHQQWTEEKLRQKFGRPGDSNNSTRPVLCAPTPNDVKYDTPPTVAMSPQQPRTPAFQAHRSENRQRKPATFYLDELPVNLDLRQTSVSDLRRLLNGASQEASAGNTDDANADFRDAVSGFSSLLSPTHEETLRAAYSYAIFYANCSDMAKADAVLNWMSEKHAERWGGSHENTYLHYGRMVELFRSWGREKHAEVLVYKILDDTRNESGTLFVSNEAADMHEGQHRHPRAAINLEPMHSPGALSTQLDKIGVAIMTDITGLDDVLETIIGYCEDVPDNSDMALQASRAKCELARLHTASGRLGETHRVLNSAKESLSPLLKVEREPMSRAIVETAQRLSRLYCEVNDQPSCNAILNQVIEALYAQRSVPSCDRELEDAFLLDFVLSIAFEFHKAGARSWDASRYWVERGLGLAIKMHGRTSSQARQFQKILDKDDFGMRTSKTVDELMKCSGWLLNVKQHSL